MAHRPANRRANLPLLLALCLLAAGAGLAAYAMQRQLAAQTAPVGFDLPEASAAPMLNPTSATAASPPAQPAPPTDLDCPDLDKRGVLPAATAEPPVLAAAELPIPVPPASLPVLDVPVGPVEAPVKLAVAQEETACPGNCVLPQGVSPMLRNWRTFVLPTFVTLALITPQVNAGEAAKDDTKAFQKKLEDLDKAVKQGFKDVAKDIKAIHEERTDWQLSIQNQIADLKTNIAALKKRSPSDVALYPSSDKGALEEVRSKLAQIERTLTQLQAQQARVSLSPPAGPTAPSGRVLLVNTYPTDMLFIVNGTTRRVAPGETAALDVPAGTLSYEVLATGFGIVGRNTTSVSPQETLTLVAR
jgi:hypothetical protein